MELFTLSLSDSLEAFGSLSRGFNLTSFAMTEHQYGNFQWSINAVRAALPNWDQEISALRTESDYRDNADTTNIAPVKYYRKSFLCASIENGSLSLLSRGCCPPYIAMHFVGCMVRSSGARVGLRSRRTPFQCAGKVDFDGQRKGKIIAQLRPCSTFRML